MQSRRTADIFTFLKSYNGDVIDALDLSIQQLFHGTLDECINNISFFLCPIEQQAEADALASDNLHWRLPLARLLGPPLVVHRNGQGPSWPSQLCHSMLVRKFHPKADRAGNFGHC